MKAKREGNTFSLSSSPFTTRAHRVGWLCVLFSYRFVGVVFLSLSVALFICVFCRPTLAFHSSAYNKLWFSTSASVHTNKTEIYIFCRLHVTIESCVYLYIQPHSQSSERLFSMAWAIYSCCFCLYLCTRPSCVYVLVCGSVRVY